jgi:hypothetical protein
MTRAALSFVALLLLAACSQNTTGTPREVTSHCGLAPITIDYGGKAWKFADADADDHPRPARWGFNTSIIYLEEIDGELIAHGPDGRDYRLVERTAEGSEGCL